MVDCMHLLGPRVLKRRCWSLFSSQDLDLWVWSNVDVNTFGVAGASSFSLVFLPTLAFLEAGSRVTFTMDTCCTF